MKTAAEATTRFQMAPGDTTVGSRPQSLHRGVGGAKDGDQGERGSTKHAPGAGPGKRVTGVGTRTASR